MSQHFNIQEYNFLKGGSIVEVAKSTTESSDKHCCVLAQQDYLHCAWHSKKCCDSSLTQKKGPKKKAVLQFWNHVHNWKKRHCNLICQCSFELLEWNCWHNGVSWQQDTCKWKTWQGVTCKILLKQVLHSRPPAAPILHITHPKNQKGKSFKVFANVGCIFH